MYNFGDQKARTQKQPIVQPMVEYMILGSEPSELSTLPLSHTPSFSYTNRYLAKRRVMRAIQRLRRNQV